MPYLTVGDPDFRSSVEFGIALIDAGAHILELGIPFSDPTADGPIIQQAMKRALAHKDFSLKKIFWVAGEIHRARPDTPLVFLSYINPVLEGFHQNDGSGLIDSVLKESIKFFLNECKECGIRGVVIPDLPFDTEESREFRKQAKKLDISQIMLVAPNTKAERLSSICQVASGFIYYVTSLGVTGIRSELPQDLQGRILKVKELSGVPVLAGFGISKTEHIDALKNVMDGVIVGSLNHKIINEHKKNAREVLIQTTTRFVDACKN